MAETIRIDAEIWDLVPEYLERRRGDLRALRTALGADDLQTLRVLGHKMRGSGASYGFARISELGRSLEQAACEGDLDGARAQVDALASHLAAIEPVRG